MVHAICNSCSHSYHWEWVEAFSKFGFDDGDGHVKTYLVSFVLQKAGYAVRIGKWLAHNEIIFSISKDGIDYLPNIGSGFTSGYDHPYKVLPRKIIELLDKAFPPTSVYSFP